MPLFDPNRSLWWLSRSRPRLRLGSIQLFPALPFFSFLALPVTLGATSAESHLHVMGLTGMGKSKLLASIAAQLVLQGEPCAVIDPHGDLAEDVLTLLVARGYYRRPGPVLPVCLGRVPVPDRA